MEVIAQECLPGLLGIWRAPRHVPGDCGLADAEAEFQKLAANHQHDFFFIIAGQLAVVMIAQI